MLLLIASSCFSFFAFVLVLYSSLHQRTESPHPHHNTLCRLETVSFHPDFGLLTFASGHDVIINIAYCTDVLRDDSTSFSSGVWVVIIRFNRIATQHGSSIIKLSVVSFDFITKDEAITFNQLIQAL
jgi:hypothetical protein